jgi:hypothetical protein
MQGEISWVSHEYKSHITTIHFGTVKGGEPYEVISFPELMRLRCFFSTTDEAEQVTSLWDPHTMLDNFAMHIHGDNSYLFENDNDPLE